MVSEDMMTHAPLDPAVTQSDLLGQGQVQGQLPVNNTNGSINNAAGTLCSTVVPTASQLFAHAPPVSIIVLIVGCVFSTLTLVIYIEEIFYTMRHFKANRGRKLKTIWILAAYPVFSLTGLLAAIVPRASLIADLVANVFFSTCIYEFMRLTIDYLGGKENIWKNTRGLKAPLRSPPCCCCCVCLPELPFVKPVFHKLQIMAYQVAIIRPILFFFAAVLWANGSYKPGLMLPNNAYMYVTIINLLSTVTAVYALVVTQRACAPILMKFKMIPKFLNYPLILLCTIIPGIIINIMVMKGLIPCTPLLPSKARGDRIYHAFLVFIMLPFSLFGRRLYRSRHEAHMYAEAHIPPQPPQQQSEKAKLAAADENQNPENPDVDTVDEKTPMSFKIEDYITAKTSNM